MELDRRTFINSCLGGLTAAAAGRTVLAGQSITPFPRPPETGPTNLTLTAGVRDGQDRVWRVNGESPGPTIRARTGDTVSIELRNRLDEPTILHWHGLDVPEEADGHPRLVIPPGASYQYGFTVHARAGTYWYHPHPDGRTGIQTYRGLAGFFLVEDDEDAALEFAAPEYDLPLLLQDKRLDANGNPVFTTAGPEHMTGFLGDRGFVNGVERPVVEVDRARYRLRLLNGCNARILQVSMNPVMSMTLIGGDGGLRATPHTLESGLLSNAERFDLLVDFSDRRPGERITLRSRAFTVPGMMMPGGPSGRGRGRGRGMMGGPGQGSPLDLVDFIVRDTPAQRSRPIPERLSEVPVLEVGSDAPRRRFTFESEMMRHRINGRMFEMDRVDVEVPLGQTEIWTFVNDSRLPHPVHVHGGGFRVLGRSGGRGRLEPWETGIKDTVLLLPNERVDVGIQFPRYRGLFLMHCHNLEHEDMGMMLNYRVV